ncbi:MAG: hypothetical protein ABJL44_07360 [Algibacter sp.]
MRKLLTLVNCAIQAQEVNTNNALRFTNDTLMKGLIWGNTVWNNYYSRIDDYNGDLRIMSDNNIYFTDIYTDTGEPFNTTLYINTQNAKVGIGTTSPASQFDVRTSDNKGIWLNFNDESAITFFPNNGNSVFHLSHGHDNKLYISQGGIVGANKLMTFVNNGNVGIGTIIPDSKLTVAGNIHAREVKVTIDAGADFVFNTDYKLRPLHEVSQFIKEHKHLPEIASEKEMQENGLHLAEMNIKLLQKIEELTLYTIEQQKEITTLKKQNTRIEELEKENKVLKSILERLNKIEEKLKNK